MIKYSGYKVPILIAAAVLLGAASTATAAPPAAVHLTLEWKEALPAETKRVTVAETRGDRKIRLAADLSTRTIGERHISIRSRDPVQKKLVEDAVLTVNKEADQLETGHFASDGSAVIAMPGGYIHYDGAAYVYHLGTPSIAMIGSVRLKNGKEALLSLDGQTPSSVLIDLKGAGDAWTTGGPQLPTGFSHDYASGDVRGSVLPISEVATQIGIPGDTEDLTFFGAWTPAGTDRIFLYVPTHIDTGEDKGDHAVLYEPAEGAGDGVADPAAAVWTSPPLSGQVIDMATGPDLRTGKGDGLYVLSDGTTASPGRTLSFFRFVTSA